MIKLKALLLEQTQPAAQGSETVGSKIFNLYGQINQLMTEGTKIIQGNKALQNSKCNFTMVTPASVAIEVIDGQTKKTLIVKTGQGQKPLWDKRGINTKTLYSESVILTELTTKTIGRLIELSYNDILEPMKQWLTKVAPLYTEFLNTAIKADPNNLGVATFEKGLWGVNDKMIIVPAAPVAAATTPPAPQG